MPPPRQPRAERWRDDVLRAIESGRVVDVSDVTARRMFGPESARSELHSILSEHGVRLCDEAGRRPFTVLKVEDLGDFFVLIQIPDSKKAGGLTRREATVLGIAGLPLDEVTCDFNVWYVTLSGSGPSAPILPTHDHMFNWYRRLRRELEGRGAPVSMYELVRELVKERKNHDEIVASIRELVRDGRLLRDIERFLATLKWIALQEDVNYKAPRYLGSKYTLAAYALLDKGFDAQDIRRIVRF